jgi:predicted transcriptional regulator
MSKAVVLSIRPQWCEKIANGEKTIEVRKTKPKLETPFKCYIYCTNIRPFLVWGDVFRGAWFTEFTRISGYSRAEADKIWDVFNGHIAGEFTCDRIYELAPLNHAPDDVEKQACLKREEIVNYLKGTGYGWHISDLRIYDPPKELSEFSPVCRYKNDDGSCQSRRVACSYQKYDYNPDGSINLVECGRTLERPPQSWCYVDDVQAK